MKISTNAEIISICREILNEQKTEEEWAGHESDDMFQTDNFACGFDADETAFCFSHYDSDGREFWFQLTLGEIKDVVNGNISVINADPAD